jgi:hypothetical protein
LLSDFILIFCFIFPFFLKKLYFLFIFNNVNAKKYCWPVIS